MDVKDLGEAYSSLLSLHSSDHWHVYRYHV